MGLNKPVDFTTAKLLKEKGFDQSCFGYYEYNNSKYLLFFDKLQDVSCNSDLTSHDFIECTAPTIAEVVMWLYEKYGVWISVEATDDFTMFCFRARKKEISRLSFNYNSPTEAYEAAIEYTLKNLI